MSRITIYKNTDVDITINVTGLVLASITEMTVSLEKDNDAPVTFSKLNNDITIGATSANLRIGDGITLAAGTYMVRIKATVGGDIRGLTPSPSSITVI